MVKDTNELHEKALALLNQRGVQLADIAELVMFLQQSYIDDLTDEVCLENVKAVLKKEKFKIRF